MTEPAGARPGRLRALGPVAALALLLAGCGPGDEAGNEVAAEDTQAPSKRRAADGEDEGAGQGWGLQSAGEGVSLVLSRSGKAEVRLFCPAGGTEIWVNVPSFRPVGSEERLSFGSGGEVVALVADTRGDRQRGGVSGTGPVPENLAALVKGPVAVNYGYQNSGPHAAPPAGLAREFVSACQEKPPGTPPPQPPVDQASACLVQDGRRLRNPPLRAIGTEPFWGARIEGRCVTYSHPEDQQGTRVWTRFKPGPGGGGTWTGALAGRPFELTVRPRPGCSDGMSDRIYPYAAELSVQGERRNGCADGR